MDWLNDDGIFLPMLNDVARLNFYEAAIAKVANGKTFVDAGAGTGLLSYLAVKYGAKKVYAVERDFNRYKLLCRMIEKLNLPAITPIHADFLTTNIEADYCVTETIGSHIFDENIIEIAKHAAKTGMITIPNKFHLSLLVHRAHPIFFLALKEHLQTVLCIADRLGEFGSELSTQMTFNDVPVTLGFNEYFPVAKVLPEIKIETLYQSEPITIDLANAVDIELILPSMYAENHAVVNVMWTATFDDIELHADQSNWALPAKRVTSPDKQMVLKYIHPRWWYTP